jgi:serine protease Do
MYEKDPDYETNESCDQNKGYEPTLKPAQDVKYYHETIREPRQKKGLAKFILGILILSIVGGASIGTSYVVSSNFLANYKISNQAVQTEQTPLSSNSGSYQVLSTPLSNPISEIAANIGPSVVSIINDQVVQTYFGDYTQSGLGSGVIFEEDVDKFYILTNAHVVEGSKSLTVTFLGNDKVGASLVGMDSQTDIAVVSVAKADIPIEILGDIRIAPLGDSDQLQVGEVAIAIGTPLDEAYNNTVTVGVISALNRTVNIVDKELNLIQTDAAINPGNSGGALVGSKGEVIGINTVKLTGGIEGMGFAIPINDVKPIAEELMTEGKIKRPAFGITATNMTETLNELYDIPVGVYIVSVSPGSTADLAGIKEKDILIEFDGQKISTIAELRELLRSKKVGDIVRVKIVRGSQKLDMQVELREG